MTGWWAIRLPLESCTLAGDCPGGCTPPRVTKNLAWVTARLARQAIPQDRVMAEDFN